MAVAAYLNKFPSAQTKYPRSRRTVKSEAFDPKTKPPIVEAKVEIERYILKSSLDPDGISKWNLFEKTLSQNFGEKLGPRQARSAFRKFIKTIHPDQTGEKSSHNFSTLVKIKDELIAALEKSLASS